MYEHYIYHLPDGMHVHAMDLISNTLRSRHSYSAGVPVDVNGSDPNRIFEIWLGQTVEKMQVIAFDDHTPIDSEIETILDAAFMDQMPALYSGLTFYRDHYCGFRLRVMDPSSVIFSEPEDIDSILAL